MSSSENITRKLFEARKTQIINEAYEDVETDELIQMAKDGDQRAFEKLLKDHEHFLYKMTKKYILDTQDEDDVRQIANIGFWDAVSKWNGSGNFEAFAGMIIKNKLTDALRKDDTGKVKLHTTAKSFDQKVITSQGNGMEYDLYDITPDRSTPSSEDAFIDKDTATKVAKYIKNNLTDIERQVMLLYAQGYKTAEISDKLGLPYKKTDNSLTRAKGKLRDFMKSNEMKESRSLRERNEFSAKEKKMLESILLQIVESEAPKIDYNSSNEEIISYANELLNKAKDINNTPADDAMDAAWKLVDLLYNTDILSKL